MSTFIDPCDTAAVATTAGRAPADDRVNSVDVVGGAVTHRL